MNNLVNILDLEIVEGTKTFRSPYLVEAVRRLKKEKKFEMDGYEEVLDFGEFILMLDKLGKETFKTRSR
jgi:hypothetical protein